MLDISPGDSILEAGTGNAGLTMHLARAVGGCGKVYTVERNNDTLENAKTLVAKFRHGQLLPSIVFSQGKLSEVIDDIAVSIDPSVEPLLDKVKDDSAHSGVQEKWRGGNMVKPLFDGIVLDMPTPWTQLTSIFGYLKTDRYVVCYLPSMSQVIDLVRACQPWPLLVEDVVEVDWRSWEVRVTTIRNPEQPQSLDTNGQQVSEEAMICRPTHTPGGHTAFLVKLRKCAETRVG
ncbi:hypothetical protein H4R26_004431 [Coemansia thaxteri]|uniref:tRNA (adenine(58)-N(1))-methyltransferase catalytic subunit TRM61 n=1 Tax=Coemansia thaxteri TaxID=2663907 RepID=A0A9W8EHK3_9FUNG|nr:hypothetical protein H4R26_004431 [Coemansia thaxteri]